MFTQDFHLSRVHTLEYIRKLTAENCQSTLYLPSGLTSETVEAHVRAAVGGSVPAQLVSAAQSSSTGACLFSGDALTLVMPPFPIKERATFSGCEIGTLNSMLEQDAVIAIILVRLGAYAVGVCRGERLLASKVGTGLVHSRQRQGGSSSQRFRRRREKQIEQFLIRVCERVDEHVGSRLEQISFVTYGGAWTTIDLLKKRCPILSQLGDRELPPLLDITDPRQAVLDAAVKRVWSSHIIEWRDDDGGR
jgi:hypothetical protein